MGFRIFTLVVFASLLGLSAAWAADLAPPKAHSVTLSGNPIPLSKALEELKKQTGIAVEDQFGSGQNLQLDLKGVPFWQAADAIANAAGARLSISSVECRIALVKRSGQDNTKVSYRGPFRIALKRLNLSRDLESGSHTAAGFVEVAWEPQLQPLYLETRPQNLTVKDDKGNVLAWSGSGHSLAPVDGRIGLTFEMPLPAPPRAVTKLIVIEGQLSAITPTRMVPFSFASLDQLQAAPANAAKRQQTKEGITCRVSKVTLAPVRWTIQMDFDAPAGLKLESYQSWVANNELVLTSKDGKSRLLPSRISNVEERGRQGSVTYHFTDRQVRGNPEDWTVSYTTPAGLVEMPIPFRFTDIALP